MFTRPEIAAIIVATQPLMMVLIGALFFVVYTLACTRYQHWSSLCLTTLCMLSGAVANTLLGVALVSAGVLAQPTVADWFQVKWELLFLAIIGVLCAMFTWIIGARRVGPLNAMLFINLIPIVMFLTR